jgi:L-lactate dehydrogenase (cytochrome)
MPAVSEAVETAEDRRIAEWRSKMPDVGSMLLVDDFEEWAEKVLSGTGWNYYRSAADREMSK